MMKKTKTPTSPRTHWLPVTRTNHSLASLPSAIRKEWENTTDSAAIRRTASKLLARWSVGRLGNMAGGAISADLNLTADTVDRIPADCHLPAAFAPGTRRAIAARRRGGFDLGEVRRGVDDRGVREGLREIAEQPPPGRIVFFGEQAEIVADRQQALEQRNRVVASPDQGKAVGQPEAARQEHS